MSMIVPVIQKKRTNEIKRIDNLIHIKLSGYFE